MSDIVYEYPDTNPVRGNISFTRFWREGEDWVQVTLINADELAPEVHTFASLPFREFEKGYLALKKSVEETKEAWWHALSKAKQK